MAETIIVEYKWDMEEHARILAGVIALEGFRVKLRRIKGVDKVRFIFRGEVYENDEFVLLARRLKRVRGGGCRDTE